MIPLFTTCPSTTRRAPRDSSLQEPRPGFPLVVALVLALSAGGPALAEWVGLAAAESYALPAEDPGQVRVDDFDGDGILDLLTVHRIPRALSFLRGNGSAGVGDGTFATPLSIDTSPSYPFGVTSAPLDDDEFPDLIVARNGLAEIRLGNGDGTFGTPNAFSTSTTTFLYPLAIDLDDDQILDIVGTSYADDSVTVLLGTGTDEDGNPTFATGTTYGTSDTPYGFAVGDFNGDTVPDLAVACSDGLAVSILLGDGDGTFGAATDISLGVETFDIAAADVDGDEILDLVLPEPDGHAIWWLPGQGTEGLGDGTFGSPVSFDGGAGPFNLAVADMNGDDLPDLVVTARSFGRVSVYPNLGGGTFGVPRVVSTDPSGIGAPLSPVLGDFDGDDLPDVAVPNSNQDNVGVLLNVGEAPGTGAVLLSEIMGDPDQVADEDGRYVELYNATDHILDLLNWSLENAAGDRGYMDGTIGPGEYFVVGASSDLDGMGFTPSSVPNGDFPTPDPTGDTLTLRGRGGTVFASVTLEDGWISGPGVSSELANLFLATNGATTSSAYVPSTTPFGADLGSPGTAGGTSSDPTATVTPVVGSGGTIDPDTPQEVPIHDTLELTIGVGGDHVLGPVGGTCGGSLNGTVFTTAPVVTDCTVEVTFLAVTGTTLQAPASILRLGEPATFRAEVSPLDGAGTVEITASTGESCVAGTPDRGTPDRGTPTSSFPCDLIFTTLGPRTVTAEYSGSSTDAASTSSPVDVTVARFADLSVTADDGLDEAVDGDPVAYSIELRNDGPDDAPSSRLTAAALPALDGPTWTCTAVGAAICPVADGEGDIDLTLDLPVGSGLDIVHSGTVPEGWIHVIALGAEVSASAGLPDGVHDPFPSNDFAVDLDNVDVFADGFETGDTGAWTDSNAR